MLPVLPEYGAMYSIPNLELHLGLLVDSHCLGCELNSHRHVVGVSKFSLDVLGEQGRLPHTCFGLSVPWWPKTITLNTILSIIDLIEFIMRLPIPLLIVGSP